MCVCLRRNVMCCKEVRSYYDDNRLHEVYEVSDDGMKNGSYRCFEKNGAPEISAFYKNDRLDGEYTRYDSRGQALEKACYVNGQRHGDVLLYGEKIAEYKNGELVWRKSAE